MEAARAIHDLPLGKTELDALAQRIDKQDQSDALVRRVINANFILGSETAADALGRFATDSSRNLDRRIDAIQMLKEWKSQIRLTGHWRLEAIGQRSQRGRRKDGAFQNGSPSHLG